MPSKLTDNIDGLSLQQVSEKLAECGENSLPEVKTETLWHKLLLQFNNPLIYILLFALSIDVGIWFYEGADSLPVEALAILIILLANASMGLWQNLKSEAALSQLKQLTAPQSWVYREGQLQHIESSQLVPGDTIRIESGERIPADGITKQTTGFMIDESILTGESAPVDKTNEQEVFSGTLAVRGFAIIEVTHTGSNSNMGKLAAMLQDVVQEKTPLEKRMDVIGKKIAIVVIIIASILLISGLSLVGIGYFGKIFLFAVALAVAAVPESLPAVITLALALGVERMAKRKAVVRKMSAVEALGSVTVIATDKTGTLTENKMNVQELDCEDLQEAYKAMVLVNDADLKTGAGDPLEIGILKYIAEQDSGLISTINLNHKKISSRPFDAEWKFMRVTTKTPQDETVSYLKGAPEIILSRCALTSEKKQYWEDRIDSYACKGYRALAIAKGNGEAEENLQWIGLILLLDPPRKEVADAISKALNAGIRILMVTGDHPATAKEIGRQIGILSEKAITGTDINNMSDSEFINTIKTQNIYARVTPEHKLRIVQSLQQLNEVVAVTGDGVNDAPALKASDVGIAMGQRGSDVSREVADLVLLDDNFSTIISAIEEGRSIYENIQKVLRSLFSSNFAEVFLISIGGLIAFQAAANGSAFILPLAAVQILWINLLTDSIPALALTTDKNPGVLSFKPRNVSEPLLDRNSLHFIFFVGIIGSVIALAILLVFPTMGVEPSITQTTVFCYLTFVQLAFVNPARKSNLLPTKNTLIIAALAISIFIQILAVTLPELMELLQTTTLNMASAGFIAGAVFISWLLAAACSYYLRLRQKKA